MVKSKKIQFRVNPSYPLTSNETRSMILKDDKELKKKLDTWKEEIIKTETEEKGTIVKNK